MPQACSGTEESAAAASARRNLTDSVPAYLLINPRSKATTKTMGDYGHSLIVIYAEIDIHSAASSTYRYQGRSDMSARSNSRERGRLSLSRSLDLIGSHGWPQNYSSTRMAPKAKRTSLPGEPG